MIPLTVEQLADVVGGVLSAQGVDAAVQTVVIDSRRAGPGALFVALPGEHADGHTFLADAARRGAVACLVAEGYHGPVPQRLAVVTVDDPADALAGLGRWVRDLVDPTVVCVTGSNGKTTTKDLTAAAVGAGRAVVASPASFNNDLGVPLTCCAMELSTEVLVAELGARGRGHVARLADLLSPDIGVVTTVSGAHLEFFTSVEGVAQAKGELVEALTADGLAVLNADDPRVAALASRTRAAVLTYGREHPADWRAEDITLDASARAAFTVRGTRVTVPVAGLHQVGNALAALAVADAVGVPLPAAAGALSGVTVSPWRSELVPTAAGVTVLNDSYNANPASMSAALETLAAVTAGGRRWAALGEMAELGTGSDGEHRAVGEYAAGLDLGGLVAVGRRAVGIARGYGTSAVTVDTAEQATRLLAGRLMPGDVVLVKASRAAGLERLAAALVEHFGGRA